ncbi:MAG TPA: PspC domain-containing protein [Acidimicrobiales bacterium]|nr:PspC domain-containing protein [Acidimicrobiales bacterium]
MENDDRTTHTSGEEPAGAETRAGSAGSPGSQPATDDRLHRVRRGRMVAGVAAGLADYLGVDPTLVRLAFVALALAAGLAVPLYLAGWLVIPEEDGGPTVAEELLARARAA